MSEIRVGRSTVLTLDSPSKGGTRHRVKFREDEATAIRTRTGRSTQQQNERRKPELDSRSRKKRTASCSVSFDSKRRKSTIVLPTKFLLGGNCTDPLNLEALDKGDIERVNRNNNSRAKDIVRVIIAPNINDPLNLDACSEDGEEELANAIYQQTRRRKQRRRKRRNSEPTSAASAGPVLEPHNRLSASLDDRDAILSHEETASPLNKKSKTATDCSVLEDSLKDSVDTRLGVTPTDKEDVGSCEVTHGSLAARRQTSCPELGKDSKEELTSPSGVPQSLLSPRTSQHKKSRQKSEDKIVSPVIPQPFPGSKQNTRPKTYFPFSSAAQKLTQVNSKPPVNYNPKHGQFQFGNYSQYYGYRNPAHSTDVRLQFFQPEWFYGGKVLDIGCNIGHITLSIGRDFAPASIIGLDIDRKLVNIARKNVKHYTKSDRGSGDNYPSSFKTLYGDQEHPLSEKGFKKFPFNVKFCQANYVLENEALLETVKPEFDVILCLSVTKWIHLNWGDKGIKRFFRRIHANLNPGGMLVLEPQAWQSYMKKKKLTPQIYENFIKINLFPDKFGHFLKSDVGFESEQKLTIPIHHSKGFQRPIYLYRKAGTLKSLLLPRDTDSIRVCEPGPGTKAPTPNAGNNLGGSTGTSTRQDLCQDNLHTGSQDTKLGGSNNTDQSRPTQNIDILETNELSSKMNESSTISDKSISDTDNLELNTQNLHTIIEKLITKVALLENALCEIFKDSVKKVEIVVDFNVCHLMGKTTISKDMESNWEESSNVPKVSSNVQEESSNVLEESSNVQEKSSNVLKESSNGLEESSNVLEESFNVLQESSNITAEYSNSSLYKDITECKLQLGLKELLTRMLKKLETRSEDLNIEIRKVPELIEGRWVAIEIPDASRRGLEITMEISDASKKGFESTMEIPDESKMGLKTSKEVLSEKSLKKRKFYDIEDTGIGPHSDGSTPKKIKADRADVNSDEGGEPKQIAYKNTNFIDCLLKIFPNVRGLMNSSKRLGENILNNTGTSSKMIIDLKAGPTSPSSDETLNDFDGYKSIPSNFERVSTGSRIFTRFGSSFMPRIDTIVVSENTLKEFDYMQEQPEGEQVEIWKQKAVMYNKLEAKLEKAREHFKKKTMCSKNHRKTSENMVLTQDKSKFEENNVQDSTLTSDQSFTLTSDLEDKTIKIEDDQDIVKDNISKPTKVDLQASEAKREIGANYEESLPKDAARREVNVDQSESLSEILKRDDPKIIKDARLSDVIKDKR